MPDRRVSLRGPVRALKSVNELVRNVFTKLNALDETQDTLAVFISDNGFLWGEHSWTGKGYPYLESVKVPFYFQWPGQALLRPSTVDNRLVANIDLAPTVLKTLGIPTIADEPMDGLNLLGAKTRDFWLLENWRNDVTIGGYFDNHRPGLPSSRPVPVHRVLRRHRLTREAHRGVSVANQSSAGRSSHGSWRDSCQ